MSLDTRIFTERSVEDPWSDASAKLFKSQLGGPSPARVRLLGIPALVAMVVLAAAWLANTRIVESIAIEGRRGIHSAAALEAATIAHEEASDVVMLAAAPVVRPETERDAASSLRGARSSITQLEAHAVALAGDLPDEGQQILDRVRAFTIPIDDALAEAADGDVPMAHAALREAGSAFGILEIALLGHRDHALSTIEGATESAERIAIGSRVLILLLIPLLTIIGYRFLRTRAVKRRELEEELDQKRRSLLAKDELIASISHELRTPLTAILGFSQEAAITPDLDAEELKSMAGIVAGEADELARMVDDLITAARDNESKLVVAIESVDPNDEMQAVQLPALIAGRQIDIFLPPVKVRADRLRLRQILRNLVSNALKYGGETVALEGVVQDDVYYLTVMDDGDGVPEALVDRLFTPFVHTGDAPLVTGSVGLGLAIAHRLAHVMDGNLTYLRQNGRTHFTLALPVAKDGESSAVKVG